MRKILYSMQIGNFIDQMHNTKQFSRLGSMELFNIPVETGKILQKRKMYKANSPVTAWKPLTIR